MNEKPTKPLFPAATILLLRDNPAMPHHPLEVMMVKRHHEIEFAAGALVFPGGKVTVGDSTVSADRIRTGTNMPDGLSSFLAAAIRECFEECGLLLAYDDTTREMVSGARAAELTRYRPLLDQGTLDLDEFLKEEHLVLAVDRLEHLAHWVGPQFAPKRFDTHFFVAAAPPDQLAIHDGHEAVDSLWVAPGDALVQQRAGKWTIIFPTRCNLELLGENENVETALRSAADSSVVRVEPWVEQRNDGKHLCIPGNAGYRTTAEPLSLAFK